MCCFSRQRAHGASWVWGSGLWARPGLLWEHSRGRVERCGRKSQVAHCQSKKRLPCRIRSPWLVFPRDSLRHPHPRAPFAVSSPSLLFVTLVTFSALLALCRYWHSRPPRAGRWHHNLVLWLHFGIAPPFVPASHFSACPLQIPSGSRPLLVCYSAVPLAFGRHWHSRSHRGGNCCRRTRAATSLGCRPPCALALQFSVAPALHALN